MLIVALALTLNNFLFAMHPKAAKPVFDWIDPFVVIGLALVFVDKILDSLKGGAWSWLMVRSLSVSLFAYEGFLMIRAPGREP